VCTLLYFSFIFIVTWWEQALRIALATAKDYFEDYCSAFYKNILFQQVKSPLFIMYFTKQFVSKQFYRDT